MLILKPQPMVETGEGAGFGDGLWTKFPMPILNVNIRLVTSATSAPCKTDKQQQNSLSFLFHTRDLNIICEILDCLKCRI